MVSNVCYLFLFSVPEFGRWSHIQQGKEKICCWKWWWWDRYIYIYMQKRKIVKVNPSKSVKKPWPTSPSTAVLAGGRKRSGKEQRDVWHAVYVQNLAQDVGAFIDLQDVLASHRSVIYRFMWLSAGKLWQVSNDEGLLKAVICGWKYGMFRRLEASCSAHGIAIGLRGLL